MPRSYTRLLGTIALSILVGIAPFTIQASEVTGTLRSDGSNGPVKQKQQNAAATSGNTLTGTVVGGAESNGETMTALAGFAENRTLVTLLSVLIPLAVLGAGAAFLVYRRRSI